jgi:STE24 endopeptidase
MRSLVLAIFLGLLAWRHLVDLGLTALSLRRARRAAGLPADLEGLFDAEVAARARAYAVARGRLELLRGAVTGAGSIALLLSGALPWVDLKLDEASVAGANGFVLFLVLLVVAVAVVDQPFAAWRSCVVERRFGLGRATLGTFFVHRLRVFLLSAAAGIPLLYVVHGVMAWAGDAWWLCAFALVASAQVALIALWPTLVAARLQGRRPLPTGPLRERLERLAARAGFRPSDVCLVDAAGRGGHANATLAGLHRPLILLDAVLVEAMTEEEVEGVVAHEIGHWRLGHVLQRLALALGLTFLVFLTLSRVVAFGPLYDALGFAQPSSNAAMVLLVTVGGLLVFVLAPLHALLSRRHEAAADAYAVRLTGSPLGLASALLELSQEHLADLWPHPWTAAWRFTHPPLLERLERLGAGA